MKVVLDTNILVSSVIGKGPPAAVLDAWVKGSFTLIVTSDILSEYQLVFERIVQRYPRVIGSIYLLDAIGTHAEVVTPATLSAAGSRNYSMTGKPRV